MGKARSIKGRRLKYRIKELSFFLCATCTAAQAGQANSFLKNAPPERTGSVYLSPTQTAHYTSPRADADMGVFAVQRKPADDDNQATNTNGTKTSLFYSEPVTPSISYSIEALHYKRYTKQKIAGIDFNSNIIQTELNGAASFKILDTHVLGAGYGYHMRDRNLGSSSEKVTAPSQLSLGYLYKADQWAIGFGYKKVFFEDHKYVEYNLHGRVMIQGGGVAGFFLRESPQESCCDMSLAKRMEYGLSWESITGPNKWELQLVNRPAFDTGIEAEITKNYLNLLYMIAPHGQQSVGIKGQYGKGSGMLRTREIVYERVELAVVYVLPI